MRQILCLRAEHGGGYCVTYRVRQKVANELSFVEKIEFVPAGGGYGLAAMVTFDTGLTRSIPEHRIISWDLAPEENQ